MNTTTPNEKGTPQSRTYTVNDIAAILGIGLGRISFAKRKRDMVCRSLVE